MTSGPRFALVVSMLAALSTVAAAPAARAADDHANQWVYVGTYTNGKTVQSKGIYVMKFDATTGKLTEPQVAAEIASPSFVAIHPNRKFLYSISEGGGKEGGPVSAFAIDAASGKLTLLNQYPSGGAGPCWVSTDPAGKVAFAANYVGGSFESLPILDDGKLGPPASFIQDSGEVADPKRQGGPHGHSLNADLAGKFALGCDLGLDKVFIFKIDPATAKLTPNDPPFAKLSPRSGPRHLALHPSGKFAYVINELASTMTAFAYDGDKGSLTELQTLSTLPPGSDAKNSCAEVQVHPSGKFLYGSNRGHDSIAVFSIDQATGKLTSTADVPCGGKHPRNFRIDLSGQWLLVANRDTDNIVVFKIDPATGNLTPTGTTVTLGMPVCLKFLPVQ